MNNQFYHLIKFLYDSYLIKSQMAQMVILRQRFPKKIFKKYLHGKYY